MHLINPSPGRWRALFNEHARALEVAVPGVRLEHVGSTAIGTIASKDVVDILVGVQDDAFSVTVESLEAIGYRLDGQRALHAWLCWPDPQNRQVILHVVITEEAEWCRRTLFRDVLRCNPELARDYESLKVRAAAITDDWTEYTRLKTVATMNPVLIMMASTRKEFVQEVLAAWAHSSHERSQP